MIYSKKKKVLVIGTGRRTRGGITSVINAHREGKQWKKFHCRWIETHCDSNLFIKMCYFLRAIIQYLCLLPFYDIIHFHFSERSTALRKSILMPIAKLMRKKIIVHFHAFSLDTTIRGAYKNIYNYLFNSADVIIVLSEYWRKALVEECEIPYGKIKVLYNPCKMVPKNDREKENNNEILFAGTLNHRKGYDDMIKAFAKIAHKYPEWKIVFAGNGEIEYGKKLSFNLGISSQTVFLGWISGNDKDKAFRRATIFCLPSYAEGFPMSVLDAWSYGLPVITTPVGGIPDIAKNNLNVLLFPPGDIDALALQMDKMISDIRLRNLIASESLNLAKTTFNVNTINRQLEDIYQNL